MRSLFLAGCMTVVLAAPLSAQYFGRNKVFYKKLDFQVLKTEHFDIYFYPEERDGIEINARMAERWHARLERLFAHTLRGRQPLVLYASHPDFEYFPYRWGQAFWAYVGGRFGDDVIRTMLTIASAAGRDTDVAIETVLGMKTKDDVDAGESRDYPFIRLYG
jgi:hypothetical protein